MLLLHIVMLLVRWYGTTSGYKSSDEVVALKIASSSASIKRYVPTASKDTVRICADAL
jgi:hypothetical protein